MKTLTDSQIRRQDFIDNAIYELLRKTNPSRREIEWNIEMIGEIRDIIRYWFVERLAITDEMNFYPYLPIDSSP